jgi:hypothetical protein
MRVSLFPRATAGETFDERAGVDNVSVFHFPICRTG